MAKGFFEVFPELQIAEELKELLNLVEVVKVTSTRDRSSIRVYIESPRLIHKQVIYSLEENILNQLFPGKELTVKIQEKYRLSSQYTPEALIEAYGDSIALELKHYSIIEYTMYRKAVFSYPSPDLVVMTVEDTMVSKEKAGELKRILEKIFQERCGLSAVVEYDYIPAKESRLRKQAEAEQEAFAAARTAALGYFSREGAEDGQESGNGGGNGANENGTNQNGANQNGAGGKGGAAGKASAGAGQ